MMPRDRRALLIQCLNCKNRVLCRENSWVLLLDDTGRCRNYEAVISKPQKAGEP